MKIARFLLVGALALIAAPAQAQQLGGRKLDAEHQLLASLSGDWTVRQSLWTTKGPPKVDAGRAKLAMVLNARHLRQSIHIDDGADFEGLGYFGYDNATKAFFSTWMDINFPGVVMARGALDPARRRITLRGQIDAAQARDAIPVREVLTLIDSDHLRYDFYETHGGVEALAVTLEYSRP